jgi:hypothetical protein
MPALTEHERIHLTHAHHVLRRHHLWWMAAVWMMHEWRAQEWIVHRISAHMIHRSHVHHHWIRSSTVWISMTMILISWSHPHWHATEAMRGAMSHVGNVIESVHWHEAEARRRISNARPRKRRRWVVTLGSCAVVGGERGRHGHKSMYLAPFQVS